jgi:hypothetical protein
MVKFREADKESILVLFPTQSYMYISWQFGGHTHKRVAKWTNELSLATFNYVCFSETKIAIHAVGAKGKKK